MVILRQVSQSEGGAVTVLLSGMLDTGIAKGAASWSPGGNIPNISTDGTRVSKYSLATSSLTEFMVTLVEWGKEEDSLIGFCDIDWTAKLAGWRRLRNSGE